MVEALSQSQEQLRTVLDEREIILESSIVGIAFLTPEGRFRWTGVPVGSVRIGVLTEDGRRSAAEVALRAGETTTVDLAL